LLETVNFVYNMLVLIIPGNRGIVLPHASTGIAPTLNGSQTLHSVFKITIPIMNLQIVN
jgi:hypothetical protein